MSKKAESIQKDEMLHILVLTQTYDEAVALKLTLQRMGAKRFRHPERQGINQYNIDDGYLLSGIQWWSGEGEPNLRHVRRPQSTYVQKVDENVWELGARILDNETALNAERDQFATRLAADMPLFKFSNDVGQWTTTIRVSTINTDVTVYNSPNPEEFDEIYDALSREYMWKLRINWVRSQYPHFHIALFDYSNPSHTPTFSFWIKRTLEDGRTMDGASLGIGRIAYPITEAEKELLGCLHEEATKVNESNGAMFYCTHCQKALPREEYGGFWFVSIRCKKCAELPVNIGMNKTVTWRQAAAAETYN